MEICTVVTRDREEMVDITERLCAVIRKKGWRHGVAALFCPPAGCPFAARCSHAMKLCREYRPELTEVGPGHKSACWLHNKSVKIHRKEVWPV